MEITFGIAFLAGLASFLSPCVISLVPVYIGYLTGRNVSVTHSEGSPFDFQAILHGSFFVLGFSLVFIALGMAFSGLGTMLYDARGWLEKAGGLVVIVFGLQMTGLLRIPFLEYDLRPRSRADRQRGLFSSFLLGIFFSAGWSPCVGPVLGAILVLAMNQAELSSGVGLLSMYSLGMAVPFLAAAAAVGWFTKVIRKYRSVLHYVEIGMGILMVIVGALLFLGIFSTLARYGSFVNLNF